MWTRAELKDRAKMCLSRYYWAGVSCEPDLCDPQWIWRIEREYPEDYKLSGAE